MTVIAADSFGAHASLKSRANSALATTMILAGLALTGPSAAAETSAFAPAPGKFCTNTTKAARISCHNDAQAEFWLAVGICQNIANASRRQACIDTAGEDRGEARDQCGEQFEARDDLCDELGEAAYAPAINPANFVTRIDNPFFPLTPGTTLIYQGQTDEGLERVVVTVTDETETILGVECTVVRDIASLDGEVIEDTVDWYAQDRHGNVWYFGESTHEVEDGRPVSVEGSFRAGEDGAQAGIVMKANPRVGDVYRQEFALGEAEDIGKVVSLTGQAGTPAASCTNCLVTADTTPIEPDADERKFYKRGVGVILEVNRVTGERLELIGIRRTAGIAFR